MDACFEKEKKKKKSPGKLKINIIILNYFKLFYILYKYIEIIETNYFQTWQIENKQLF